MKTESTSVNPVSQSVIRNIGLIGSRSLPSHYAEKVSDVVDDLLDRGFHIASGGAVGADQYAIERLLRLGMCDCGTIYTPWKYYAGFPATVRAMTRQFKEFGGSIIWGLVGGKESAAMIKTALLQRNVRLVDACHGLTVFLSHGSRGSIFSIKQAVKQHMPMVVFPMDCLLPDIPSVKWKALRCGGIWDNGYKAVYLR